MPLIIWISADNWSPPSSTRLWRFAQLFMVTRNLQNMEGNLQKSLVLQYGLDIFFLDMKNIWFAGIFGPLSCTFLIMSAAQEKGSKDRLFWCTGCKFGLLPFIDLFPDLTKLSTFDVFGWEGENLDSFSDFLVFMIIWWLSCSGKFFLKCQCTLTYYSQAEKPDVRTSFLLWW